MFVLSADRCYWLMMQSDRAAAGLLARWSTLLRGWPGRVGAPGEWGRIVNGGGWLRVNGTKVDLIYWDLGGVLGWTAAGARLHCLVRSGPGTIAAVGYGAAAWRLRPSDELVGCDATICR